MVSTENVGGGVGTSVENGCGFQNNVSIQISTSRKGLLSDGKSPREIPENGTSLASRLKMLKISPRGKPSGGFQRMGEEYDEGESFYAPVKEGLRRRFNSRLFKEIDWNAVTRICKEWVRRPLNMVLLLWMACVVVSGAILFLVMTGMLNSALQKKSQRDMWFEVNNQIISALFTLMCLYLHPKRFYHLVLLCRWQPEDMSHLRKIYCKNGSYKPNERIHMMVVFVLLHINCFAQYALCGFNLAFRRAARPVIGVGVCLSVAIAAPGVAGLYATLSPLGKDYELDADEEAPEQLRRHSLEKTFAFATTDERVIVEMKPKWAGGLFSLWEDFSVAYLSLFCGFCVFGWNMERLGFGNMYVHIATFLLFCTAPFWILNLAATNIDNDTVRQIIGISGIALSVFGLLYGGFWRIQMRKRFNLPSNNSYFGKPDVADCVQWLFCCWCSLAQEVRTGDSYEIVEDRFYRKNNGNECDSHTPLTPVPHENRADSLSNSDLSSSLWLSSSLSKIKPSSLTDEIMTPPVPVTMRVEAQNVGTV